VTVEHAATTPTAHDAPGSERSALHLQTAHRPEPHGLPHRGSRLLVGVLVLADIVALAVACFAAYVVRANLSVLDMPRGLSAALSQSSLIIAGGWLVAILLFGGYNTRLLPSGAEIYRNVLYASLAAVGIVGVYLFLTDVPLSRPFFVALFLIGPVLLLAVRFVARHVLSAARTRGRLRTRVVVVGSAGHARGIARTLQREVWLGYDVVGAVAPVTDDPSRFGPELPVLGDESELLSVVRDEEPETVLFAAGSSASAEEFRRVAWDLEDQDVDVIVVPALSEISSDRISMRPVAGLPLVHMDLPRSRQALRWTKRLFDIVGSVALLLVLSPLLAVIALGVKLNDGGPVIFRQERVGRGGASIEFLKFRSMVVDAEARRLDLVESAGDRGNAVMFKLADDPRITRIGRILRRYSLDELPQLWNVLRGDMSLVGPRPALPAEVSSYDEDAHRRLAVRPGITGLWQVSGRSDLAWDDTVRLDLFYVDNWSFMQDMLILARTLRAVVASRGAY
jgi:exopolysaccharide biosynthesis polyprenyl glycosylphosphotransferase